MGSPPAVCFLLPASCVLLRALAFTAGVARGQYFDEAAQHAPDIFDLLSERGMLLKRQEPKVQGKKQIILKFVAGTQRMPEESAEVRIRASARTFSNIGRDRNGGPQGLVAQGPRFRLLETRRNAVRREGQFVRFLPHP
jgi:hypothetical protein